MAFLRWKGKSKLDYIETFSFISAQHKHLFSFSPTIRARTTAEQTNDMPPEHEGEKNWNARMQSQIHQFSSNDLQDEKVLCISILKE